ncbi:unnamed protein product [Rhodiola kirilowii]
MERINTDLYLKNCYMLRENERLRMTMQKLDQENKALLSQLHQRLISNNNASTSSSINREASASL